MKMIWLVLALPAVVQCASDNGMNDSDTRKLMAPDARPVKIAGGFAFTEGPTPDAAGNVYFTDQPNNSIHVRGVDGALATFMKPAGRANGMSFGREGTLFVCADEKNELWAVGRNKEKKVLVKEYEGKLLNGPNDVWEHPDGSLYFTDPYYRRPYWSRGPQEQPCEGVYRVSPDRKRVDRVCDDLAKPNGIVGTPDGGTLFVADIGAGRTYAYSIGADGRLSGKRLFHPLGSDGMTIDESGNLYLTGRGVTVVSPAGKKIATVPIGEEWTSNVCFGGTDRRTLFITAGGSLYALPLLVRGVE